MAIITRYFSTSAAGAGNGTTWADRAALFTTGNWSTVITGFAFNASDSLVCMIEGGLNYTCGQTLAAALFLNPPTVSNPLFLHGCDSFGVLLIPSDENWTSDQPVTWNSAFPSIDTTINIATINLANCFIMLMAFTGSARNGGILTLFATLTWVSVINTTSNVAAICVAITAGCFLINVSLRVTGTAYSAVFTGSNAGRIFKVRAEGNLSASSGTRNGILFSGTVTDRRCDLCTSINNPGVGFLNSATSGGQGFQFMNCLAANNGGNGFTVAPSVAAQTANVIVRGCVATGNGGYGFDAQTTNPGKVFISRCRARDNTSGNFNNFGNYPIDLNNFTTDSDDSTEYIDATSGNFRIKNTSLIWNQGYGVSNQEPVKPTIAS